MTDPITAAIAHLEAKRAALEGATAIGRAAKRTEW